MTSLQTLMRLLLKGRAPRRESGGLSTHTRGEALGASTQPRALPPSSLEQRALFRQLVPTIRLLTLVGRPLWIKTRGSMTACLARAQTDPREDQRPGKSHQLYAVTPALASSSASRASRCLRHDCRLEVAAGSLGSTLLHPARATLWANRRVPIAQRARRSLRANTSYSRDHVPTTATTTTTTTPVAAVAVAVVLYWCPLYVGRMARLTG